MGMADAADDAAKAPNKAPNRDAATRPFLRFMMSSFADAGQDIEVVPVKLWRRQNVMLMNKIFGQLVVAAGSARPAQPLLHCNRPDRPP